MEQNRDQKETPKHGNLAFDWIHFKGVEDDGLVNT